MTSKSKKKKKKLCKLIKEINKGVCNPDQNFKFNM